MDQAILVAGLGFGDEGKGATVDFLCRDRQAEWVTRYCGGAQAGHTVEVADGRRHTFSQFGAGTLAGAKTYLGPEMVMSLPALAEEAQELERKFREDEVPRELLQVWIHPRTLLSTPYHVVLDHAIHAQAGMQNMSCGRGVGQTRRYWRQYGFDVPLGRDLRGDTRKLAGKLTLCRDRLREELHQLNAGNVAVQAALDLPPYQVALAMQELAAKYVCAITSQLPDCRTMVFEGSQGLLLDEYYGFPPHTTWSTVTPQPALELLSTLSVSIPVVRLGVTRAYSTRHGAGPFPSERPQADVVREDVHDRGNPTNPHQGRLRYGAFDVVLCRYALRAMQTASGPVGIVINCLDQVPEPILVCHAYNDVAPHGSLKVGPRPTAAEQSRLAVQLCQARPAVLPFGREAFLAMFRNIGTLAITADGPTAAHRQWHDNAQTRKWFPQVTAAKS